MHRSKGWLLLIVFIFSLILSNCSDNKPKVVWRNYLLPLGTSSSPRCIDLTGDDILDVVIGAGKNEFEYSDSSVVAFDGIDGHILWTASAADQIVGSPTFLMINGDDTPDVIIGGRTKQLMALDGANGKVIWRYEGPTDTLGVLKHLRFNFYNAQLVPDQDHDGIEDLLIANGGNVNAQPFSEKGRYPGVLAIFSARTGKILAADTMPDGRETYMSPVVHDFEGNGNLSILYGTGGESIGGTFYKASLTDLLAGKLVNSKVILTREGKGFIAPPVLSDITRDGTRDIICNWFGGEVIALDGKKLEVLWTVRINDTEMYNTVTPGHVNDDDIPDFFNIFNRGAWPSNTGTLQVVIDGASGKVIYSDSLGCSGYASAVSYDLTGDGYDEFLWNTNDYNCNGIFLGEVEYQLLAMNVHEGKIHKIGPKTRAKNVSTTPWLGDMDGNGKLDIVYCIQQNTVQIHTYIGIQMERTEFDISIEKGAPWGEYMGPSGRCIF